ncbi:hypothetical protein FRC10_002635 [Ceratobasidium sp. 414]|nr:hypothetical protein FRC10_002635 [Ceratobasidium sp. 414]
MASQHPGGGRKRVRHRIQEIKLEPSSCKYDVTVELLVDGKKVHELSEIKKGQSLSWGDLSLPCDVHETSTIAITITETRTVKSKRESATYQPAQVVGQDSVSIGMDIVRAFYCQLPVIWILGCAGGRYTAKVTILSGERAERAYQEAFTKAQRIGTQPSVIERTGRVGAAFKKLLAFGSAVADCLEAQDQQNKKLNKLVEDLAGMIPSLELVKHFANANLGETVTAMLDLIEDVSLFILGFYSRSSWTQMLSFAPFYLGVQDQVEVFVTEFEKLGKE